MFGCPQNVEESSMAMNVMDDSTDRVSGLDDCADGVNVVDAFVDGNSDCSDVDVEACTRFDMVGDEDLTGECALLSDVSTVEGVG